MRRMTEGELAERNWQSEECKKLNRDNWIRFFLLTVMYIGVLVWLFWSM